MIGFIHDSILAPHLRSIGPLGACIGLLVSTRYVTVDGYGSYRVKECTWPLEVLNSSCLDVLLLK